MLSQWIRKSCEFCVKRSSDNLLILEPNFLRLTSNLLINFSVPTCPLCNRIKPNPDLIFTVVTCYHSQYTLWKHIIFCSKIGIQMNRGALLDNKNHLTVKMLHSCQWLVKVGKISMVTTCNCSHHQGYCAIIGLVAWGLKCCEMTTQHNIY